MSGATGVFRIACLSAAALCIAGSAVAAPLSVVANFAGSDVAKPQSKLLVDSAGHLLGTSPFGGSAGQGSVYVCSPGGGIGAIQVVYSFSGKSDGSAPYAGLVSDSDGNLYGVASAGGDSGAGTVFELVRNGSSYAFERLYSFTGGSDGGAPIGGLAIDASGNLYGTTALGGSAGTGTVFEITPRQPASLTTLYAFSAVASGINADGAIPEGAILLDSAGNIFGTAAAGGPSGDGVAFELSPGASGYAYSGLHAFSAADDGTTPLDGLVSDPAGDLFGSTAGDSTRGLWGTVFELERRDGFYSYRTLYTFRDADDGAVPLGSLTLDAAGDVLGTAGAGGPSGAGTVFELFPQASGFGFRVLYAFADGLDGGLPASGLVAGADGRLYGTTEAGGVFGWGTVFALVPPPTAASQILFAIPGASVAITLSAADPNLPGAAFTFAVASPPARGTLTSIGADGRLTYTPSASFRGSDEFTFTAADANGASNPATVSITATAPVERRIVPAAPPAGPAATGGPR